MEKQDELRKMMLLATKKFEKYNELSLEEMGELARLMATIMMLSRQKSDKREAELSNHIKVLEGQLEQYEIASEIVNTFVLERGLAEELEGYAAEVMDDFEKSKITLQ